MEEAGAFDGVVHGKSTDCGRPLAAHQLLARQSGQACEKHPTMWSSGPRQTGQGKQVGKLGQQGVGHQIFTEWR